MTYSKEHDEAAKTLTIVFDEAIVVPPTKDGKTQFDTLSLRQPKIGELKKALETGKGDIDQTMRLIISISGWPPSAIEQIDLDAWSEINDFLGSFGQTKKPGQ